MIINEHLKKVINSGSAVRSIFELGFKFKKEGKSPIDLSIGNPDIKPPGEYYDVLDQAIKESRSSSTNSHRYMSNSGYFETKKRVAADLSQMYGLNFRAENIFMTVGAANALDVLLSTLIEPVITFENDIPGLRKTVLAQDQKFALDEIITIAPYFVEYRNLIKSNQGKQVVVYSDEKYRLDIASIEKAITKKTKAILLNSPNNPTGAVYGEEELISLAELLKNKNDELGITIAVIEDAAYGLILFGENKLYSILPHYKYTFFVTSFSKSLGLAGERIGYFAVHPYLEDDADEWEVLQSALAINLRIKVVNAPALQQRIIERIGSFLKVDTKAYERRMNRLTDTLENLGFQFERPNGGFYIFIRLPSIFKDEADFRQAAHEGDQPLLYVPGIAFGGKRYERYLRLSVCASNEDIERACRRLKELCGKRIYRQRGSL